MRRDAAAPWPPPPSAVRCSSRAYSRPDRERRPAPRPRPEPYTATTAELEAFTGRYVSADLNSTFDVAVGENGVIVRLNNAQTIPFPAAARDLFQRGPLTVRFVRDDAARITGLDFTTPARRNVRFVAVP